MSCMDTTNKDTTVYVGMSGGVDSSVSAALLKEQGYDVRGVFIKAWHPDWMPCTWRGERRDAARVAAQLGIPFTTLDLSREYKKEVIDYMIREYGLGRTPNPDVMCNKHVKFGGFLNWAVKEGADHVATGHYAQARREDGVAHLYAGKDTNKDQSYFLWTLTQKQLERTLFPVGALEKGEVRKHAERFGLVTADKKDSQGLCFLGHVDIREFLKHYIEVEPGDVLDTDGNVVGGHEGALLYTIGQRHGFTVHAQHADESPKYVVSKDITQNTLTIAPEYKEQDSFGVRKIALENTNWVVKPPRGECEGRVRYRQPLQSCRIVETQMSNAKVLFDEPQHGVALGQSVVLYKDGECLGGGIIIEATKQTS